MILTVLMQFFESILYKYSSNNVKRASTFTKGLLSNERFRIRQLWQSSTCEEESRQKAVCNEINVHH